MWSFPNVKKWLFWRSRQKKIENKLKKPKLLEIAWNGEKIDRKCFLKFLTFYPWSFSSLLALLGVIIEKGLHWLPKATIASRLQRGVAPWSRSSAPARGRSMSDGFPQCAAATLSKYLQVRKEIWSKISKNIFDQFSRHFRQFQATLFFFPFSDPIFF